MRLLDSPNTRDALKVAIASHARCDYVYMYPPRQAYRPFGADADVPQLVRESLARTEAINLYVHIPFCRQICGFCNLYTVTMSRHDVHQRYIEALGAEVRTMAEALAAMKVNTVYFGGGTPSLLQPELLEQAFSTLTGVLGFSLADVPEVAIEVAPDNASSEGLAALRSVGFNRINLGVQTTSDEELRTIGRRYVPGTIDEGIANALRAGFHNVCVDLIYGLPGQSLSTWQRSVDHVIDHRPQTVCAYALTLRSGTRFGDKESPPATSNLQQYEKYDYADCRLRAAGYEQQTHVRWALPGRGGYLQKQLHWAGESVLGFGAGARSYLWDIDTRNGYSLHPRRSALDEYFTRIDGGADPRTDGFLMDNEERQRKAIILGLNHLDRRIYSARFGIDPLEAFPHQFASLSDLGLIADTDDSVELTPLGVRHRDIAVQPFISPRVRRLVDDFTYVE